MKTKNKLASIALTLGLALAMPSAHAKDPCESSICMWGMLTGTNKSQCSSSISDYFSIIVFKKGKPQLSKTAAQRLSFLQSCQGADPSAISMINAKFGKMIM